MMPAEVAAHARPTDLQKDECSVGPGPERGAEGRVRMKPVNTGSPAAHHDVAHHLGVEDGL